MSFLNNDPLRELKSRKKRAKEQLKRSFSEKETSKRLDYSNPISGNKPSSLGKYGNDFLREDFNPLREPLSNTIEGGSLSKPFTGGNSTLSSDPSLPDNLESNIGFQFNRDDSSTSSVINSLKGVSQDSYNSNILGTQNIENSYGGMDKKDNLDDGIPQRVFRRSIATGDLTSFFHIDDLKKLESFISERETSKEDYVKSLKYKLKQYETKLDRLLEIHKHSLNILGESESILSNTYNNVKNYFDSGDTELAFGGEQDSDGFSNEELIKSRVYEDNLTSTTLTSTTVRLFKEPFDLSITKYNNFEYKILFLLNCYFQLSRLLQLLKNLDSESKYSKSKEYIDIIKGDLLTFLNVRSDTSI